jgi:hypothetical protein
MVFVMRKLDRTPHRLGDKLRALRNGQAVTMDMLVRHTRIQRKYLEALERGDYASLPEPLYVRNFIRAYTRYLKADEHYFIELFDEECGQCDLVRPSLTPRQRLKSLSMMAWHRLAGILTVASVLLIFGSFVVNQFVKLTKAPDLFLMNPAADIVTNEAFIEIKGKVDADTSVLVNGVSTPVSEGDIFLFALALDEGINTVTVRATRRYSRPAVVERKVIYKPEVQPLSRQ